MQKRFKITFNAGHHCFWDGDRVVFQDRNKESVTAFAFSYVAELACS